MDAICENMDHIIAKLIALGASMHAISLDGITVKRLTKRENRRWKDDRRRDRLSPNPSHNHKRSCRCIIFLMNKVDQFFSQLQDLFLEQNESEESTFEPCYGATNTIQHFCDDRVSDVGV